MIHQKEFTFSSPADGILLEGTYIFPEMPRGIVQFVHGMAEVTMSVAQIGSKGEINDMLCH